MSDAGPGTAGKLTTHVLDTAGGRPAAGMTIELYRLADGGREHLGTVATNDDGRCDQPLLAGDDFGRGEYELIFHVGAYFQTESGQDRQPAFLGLVPVRFGIAKPGEHYHVPLLVSPFAYSTYRGS